MIENVSNNELQGEFMDTEALSDPREKAVYPARIEGSGITVLHERKTRVRRNEGDNGEHICPSKIEIIISPIVLQAREVLEGCSRRACRGVRLARRLASLGRSRTMRRRACRRGLGCGVFVCLSFIIAVSTSTSVISRRSHTLEAA